MKRRRRKTDAAYGIFRVSETEHTGTYCPNGSGRGIARRVKCRAMARMLLRNGHITQQNFDAEAWKLNDYGREDES